MILLFALTYVLQETEKRLPVCYADARFGGGESVSEGYFPVKLCPGGVVPVIFASTILGPLVICRCGGTNGGRNAAVLAEASFFFLLVSSGGSAPDSGSASLRGADRDFFLFPGRGQSGSGGDRRGSFPQRRNGGWDPAGKNAGAVSETTAEKPDPLGCAGSFRPVLTSHASFRSVWLIEDRLFRNFGDHYSGRVL